MINFDARNLSIFSTGETPLQVTQARVSHTGFFLVSRVFTRRNNTNNHLYVSIRGSMCPSMKTRAGLECRERVKPTASNLPSVLFSSSSSSSSFFFQASRTMAAASLYCRWVCIGCGQTSSPCVKLVAIICGFIFKDGREEDGVGWSTVFVANKCTGHGCREAMPSSAFHRVTDAPERRCIDSGCRKRLRGASRWPWFRIIC